MNLWSGTALVSRRSALGMLGATATALTVGGTAHAGDGTTSASSASVPRKLRPGGEFDQFVAGLADRDEFAGTVLLIHRGRPALERSYGMADRAAEIPNGADTLFSVASVTKLFTSLAILQLVERGAISLHEKVGTYLDGFPTEVADAVTVHQLLTHTSGLGDYHRIGDFLDQARTWDSVEENWAGCLRYVQMDRPTFTPGSGGAYSNTGYFILGAIVAAVTDLPSYYDHVHEHVFAPAGMTDSGFFTTPEWRTDRRFAHPYAKDDNDEWADGVERHELFVGTPAGGSFSTAADLASFSAALLDDDLLGAAHTQLYLSPLLPTGGSPGSLGFATYGPVATLAGQWFYQAHGGAVGVSADLDWYVDTDWVVIVLSNYDEAGEPVRSLAEELILAQ